MAYMLFGHFSCISFLFFRILFSHYWCCEIVRGEMSRENLYERKIRDYRSHAMGENVGPGDLTSATRSDVTQGTVFTLLESQFHHLQNGINNMCSISSCKDQRIPGGVRGGVWGRVSRSRVILMYCSLKMTLCPNATRIVLYGSI